jgi:putative oxidoreductase
MATLRNFSLLAGRVLMAAIFVYDAVLLARFPVDNIAYMESFGVPGVLLWPTAIFQFVGGLMIMVGLLTRLVSLGFAAFCLLTALTFHRNLADPTELIQFGKDLGLAGGFLFLAAGGAGAWALDAWFRADCFPLSRLSRDAVGRLRS